MKNCASWRVKGNARWKWKCCFIYFIPCRILNFNLELLNLSLQVPFIPGRLWVTLVYVTLNLQTAHKLNPGTAELSHPDAECHICLAVILVNILGDALDSSFNFVLFQNEVLFLLYPRFFLIFQYLLHGILSKRILIIFLLRNEVDHEANSRHWYLVVHFI